MALHRLRAALAAPLVALPRRLALIRGKGASLAGHPRLARRLAGLIRYYEHDGEAFFRADDPPAEVAAQRRAGFEQLSDLYRVRFAASACRTRAIAEGVSDQQFTDAYRVPFQFSRYVRRHLQAGSVLSASSGVTVTDLDGNQFYDLSGSYGVNLLGYDFYKACIDEGVRLVRDLGPVLGFYHPVVEYNVARLRQISGLDEVSFHMSGTEAVMQAVRLARYHTGRRRLVRFHNAYHGWWGDVQPGVGNPVPARDTFTLREMSEDALRVLRTRRDIACVLVNPLQALHPNAVAPSDSALIDGTRHGEFDKRAYSDWLARLRSVCTERGIVLILDEVFTGFRLAPGGAQEYFGVAADLVTYGKTLGGGLPVGVLCGRKPLMRRFRDDRPADICFARGTFNSHPYVMASMSEFLRHLETPAGQAAYAGLDGLWDGRARRLNARLEAEELPVRVANLSTIWTVRYTTPARYHWMLQYYLRAEGLLLSWVGTGRFIFSLNYGDADFAAVTERFVAGARAMARDGWWWCPPEQTHRSIRRRVLEEILRHRLARPERSAAAAAPSTGD